MNSGMGMGWADTETGIEVGAGRRMLWGRSAGRRCRVSLKLRLCRSSVWLIRVVRVVVMRRRTLVTVVVMRMQGAGFLKYASAGAMHSSVGLDAASPFVGPNLTQLVVALMMFGMEF